MNTKYNIGDIVFLKTDKEQEARIITGILIRPNGYVFYLSKSDLETTHYEIEFTSDINELIKLFN
jgi:hypothetical protein